MTVALALVAAGALLGWIRLPGGRLPRLRPPRRATAAPDELARLGELVFIGLTAGLSLRAAIDEAGRHVGEPLAGDLDRLMRLARRIGLAAALAGDRGSAGQLSRLVARAHLTGAPTAAAVAAFVTEQRRAARVAELEDIRRLPVRLVVPLALLVLPGTVLLAAGPAALGALVRITGAGG